MTKKIFLSYSRKDKEFAKKVADDLVGAGHDVWWDISAIEGGDRWAKEIEEGLNQSEILAIIVSKNSIASEWVEKEFLFASRRGMKIVPLLYEHCELPIWLLNLQYVDLIGANYELNFQQVLEAFEKYGRRSGDAKAISPKTKKWLAKASPYWFLLIIIALLVLLVGILLKPFPTVIVSPTNTVTRMPTKISTPTKTMTMTLAPPTETGTSSPMPTDADEKTETPTQTATRTPMPSETPTPEGLAPVITDTSGAEMMLVKESPFLMGYDAGNDDEKPAHIVSLDAYYIDKHEVTNADYKACVDALACELPKTTTFYVSVLHRNHPVVYVSWEKAIDFCEWRDARLPTEAEWEKAARGTESISYPWGNSFSKSALNYCDLDCEYSWADKSFRDHYTTTAPVGTYPRGESPYGTLDMAGNVAEWVADWYDNDYYKESPQANPFGAETGIYRVLRGGSWYNKKTDVRTFQRSYLRPNVAYNYIGFRCATDAKE